MRRFVTNRERSNEMRVTHKVDRLLKAYETRWCAYIKTLNDEELVFELLCELQRSWGEIRQEHIEVVIAAGGGRLEEWQETVECVLEERCQPLGKHRWRLKR
jgi:hypothetical protein